MCLINDYDLLFFDDCLYSQYVFLKQNNDILKQKNVVCVMGLTTKAIRPENNIPKYDIQSSELHLLMNKQIKTYNDVVQGDYINGFMSLSEIYELIQNENIFLAFHGCCHLNLQEEKSKIYQTQIFRRDICDGVEMLKQMNLTTDIFVYPYAYQPFLGNKILTEFGFRYIFAGENTKRISIERLNDEFHKYSQK